LTDLDDEKHTDIFWIIVVQLFPTNDGISR